MTGLVRTISRSSNRELFPQNILPGAEQDQGYQGALVFVSFFVHVIDGVDRVNAEPVGVNDHRIHGRFTEALGAAFRVGDQ